MTMRTTPPSMTSARNIGSLHHRSGVRLTDHHGEYFAHGLRFPQDPRATGLEVLVPLFVHVQRVQDVGFEHVPPGNGLPINAFRYQDLPLDLPECLVMRLHPRPDGLERTESGLAGGAALPVEAEAGFEDGELKFAWTHLGWHEPYAMPVLVPVQGAVEDSLSVQEFVHRARRDAPCVDLGREEADPVGELRDVHNVFVRVPVEPGDEGRQHADPVLSQTVRSEVVL